MSRSVKMAPSYGRDVSEPRHRRTTDLEDRGRVLIVASKKHQVMRFEQGLHERGFEPVTVESVAAANELVRTARFDSIIVQALDIDDADACSEIAAQEARIILRASATETMYLAALRSGIDDIIDLADDPDELALVLDRAANDTRSLRELNRLGNEPIYPSESARPLVGTSRAICEIHRRIPRAARRWNHILLVGEKGTGKEHVAHMIHARSGSTGQLRVFDLSRADMQLKLVDALGTSARNTVFLVTIEAIPSELARSLSSYLDHKEPAVNAPRLIVACEPSLLATSSTGTMSSVLAASLSSLERIELPPLRDRIEDVSILAERRLSELCFRDPPRLSHSAVALLEEYSWPGNIDELYQVIEAASLAAEGGLIDTDSLDIDNPLLLPSAALLKMPVVEWPPLRELENAHIERVVERAGGNRTRAAELLGIDRRSIYRRLAKKT